jgi:dTDP-4-amino-4,6-dideoxygalactose transaminase
MISVFGSSVGPEEMEEVRSSLEVQWMGIGPKVKKFEEAFSNHLGVSDFAMLDSGSNSLYMAVKLLNLPIGSEVILPSFTWISCAHAVVLCGCKPVFCDVDLNTHNVTREAIEPHLSPRTKAIMVVHYAGKPVCMNPILQLGFPVIEDAAHAVDSQLDGKACGAIGTVGIFSFDAVKNLATPDGGGLTAQDTEWVARSRLLRYCGIGKSGFESSATKERWWEYNIAEFFPRFLPNDISASIALAQLAKLPRHQLRRKHIWELYQKEFAELGWFTRPVDAASNEKHSFFTYCGRVLNGKRNALAKYLYEKGIYTTLRYHPLHLNPIYQSSARLPNSEQLNEEALNLPIHPRLSEDDLQIIITSMKQFNP